jgi:hypothetical protein
MIELYVEAAVLKKKGKPKGFGKYQAGSLRSATL